MSRPLTKYEDELIQALDRLYLYIWLAIGFGVAGFTILKEAHIL